VTNSASIDVVFMAGAYHRGPDQTVPRPLGPVPGTAEAGPV
jgi:hypothetical protein